MTIRRLAAIFLVCLASATAGAAGGSAGSGGGGDKPGLVAWLTDQFLFAAPAPACRIAQAGDLACVMTFSTETRAHHVCVRPVRVRLRGETTWACPCPPDID